MRVRPENRHLRIHASDCFGSYRDSHFGLFWYFSANCANRRRVTRCGVGWKLLNRGDEEEKVSNASPRPLKLKASYLSQRAFYPLTLPLTVGPGSISVAIAVGASRPPGNEIHWALPVAAFVGCAVIAATIYLSYRFAEAIDRALGDTAMSIFIRLSSFILLCIGVQIVWNGVSKLLSGIR
jgi:multiple antibiotic resistance protein